MKTAFKFLFVSSLIILTQACMQAPEGEKVEAEGAATTETASAATGTPYMVDPAASMIKWTGAKPTGKSHHGTISIAEGKLLVDNGNVTGGKVALDMNSIDVQDLEAGNMRDKLMGHLRSDDFFSVEAHPTGTFEIISVEKADGSDPAVTHRIKGNLTLKGITKAITIPAKVSMDGDKLIAQTPAFTINRTEWDVNYKSTVIGTLADELIHDEVGLELNLVAAPATM
ncbi:MAG: YceI family protein [Phaeodactylibacter sp.]|nr:YceI family protein [Phaeodactylibacter sp.]